MLSMGRKLVEFSHNYDHYERSFNGLALILGTGTYFLSKPSYGHNLIFTADLIFITTLSMTFKSAGIFLESVENYDFVSSLPSYCEENVLPSVVLMYMAKGHTNYLYVNDA